MQNGPRDNKILHSNFRSKISQAAIIQHNSQPSKSLHSPPEGRRQLSSLASITIANTPIHTAMSSLRLRRPSLLLVALFILSLLSPNITAKNSSQGLWGSIKESADSTTQPVRESICSRYNKLSDKGRFLAGACAGYGASRFVVGSKFCLHDADYPYSIQAFFFNQFQHFLLFLIKNI